MPWDRLWLLIISDLFVNLAAGWLGAVFIVPVTSKRPIKVKVGLLTTNLMFAIFSLIAAFELRKLGG